MLDLRGATHHLMLHLRPAVHHRLSYYVAIENTNSQNNLTHDQPYKLIAFDHSLRHHNLIQYIHVTMYPNNYN